MKHITALLLCIISLQLSAVAQQPRTVHTNSYQNVDNPLYWKNRKPVEGYWQQDVHYRIHAVIDDSVESITGEQQLVYTNNSPDTLNEVYFHLYQNAFTPNSYLHQQRKEGKLVTRFGEHEQKGVGTAINNLEIDGQPVKYSIDNTIMHIQLPNALKPGMQIRFDISFVTYWDKDDGGNIRRRMKTFDHTDVTHFDGVHWYPRICVYDRKFGWTTDQHIGKEFYGDFGLFEVQLDFPNQYVVEATGTLTNEPEVLPAELRSALDLKNYKTSRSIVTDPIRPDGTRKIWKYSAVNVHDFAFTADPTYRIAEEVVDGVRCIVMAQEKNAHKWQQTAKFLAEVVKVYSRDFGKYHYPKIVAADARDGMEYPMITLNSGNWPGHQYVIAHEVGHNWFFGMVGNNETYRSALDEGFTQFLTAWSLKKINNVDHYGNQVDKSVVFNRYLSHASGSNNATLNVHADHYNSAERHGGGYGMVYFKTATMLYNLQYVLGDELFLAAMKNYFNQWKFAHPYWEDFKRSIMDYTHTDLNWFFDQWITTTKTIDYAVGKVKRVQTGYTVELKRKGGMQMPLDIAITYTDGTVENHYVPNSYFVKSTKAVVHPKWTGWDQVNPTYTMSVETNKKIKSVVIDPSERLADINRLNNSNKSPVHFAFSKVKRLNGNFDRYEMRWHPNLWYNQIDGLKTGLTFFGNFANQRHVFFGSLWYNTGLLAEENANGQGPLSYRLSYSDQLSRNNRFGVYSNWNNGLHSHAFNWHHYLNKGKLRLQFQSLYRNQANNLNYLYIEELWNHSMFNNTLDLEYTRKLKGYKASGELKLSTRTSALYSDYGYGAVEGEYKHRYPMKGLTLKTRVFAKYISGNVAPESQLMLSGANREQQVANKYMDARTIVPSEWVQYSSSFGHWHEAGGLNLRAYSGYKATNATETDTFYVYRGNAGGAINMELDFGRKLDPFHGKTKLIRMNTYLFGDAGVLYNGDNSSGMRVDAGIGTALTIKPLGYNYYRPLVIRFDIPFFVNRLPNGQSDYLGMRYVVGLSRAF